MTRAPRLLLAAAFAVVAALAGPGLAPGPAAAADACEGVWVIVEPRTLGGSSSKRCAPGAPATGLAALEGAGHRYTFVPRQPGMVCTIDARPDPCNGAPSDAYWAYFHAEAGASNWTYSNRGAGNRTPAPGTAEAWVFGGGQPSTPPPAAATPSPAPKDPPASGGSTGGSSGGSGSTGGSTGSSGSPGGSTGGDSPASSSSGSGSGTNGGSGSTGASNGGSSGGSGSIGDGGTTGRGDREAVPSGAAERSSTSSGTERRREARDDAARAGADATGRDGDDDGGERPDGAAPADVDPDLHDDGGSTSEDDRLASAVTDDTVSIGRSGGAGRAIGTALAGTLAAGLAAAGVVRVRRRGLAPTPGLGG